MSLDLKKHSEVAAIRVVERGKDAEYWQGHFGACFAQEALRVYSAQSSGGRSLVKRMKYRRTCRSLPFGTFFNDGMGQRCFFEGTATNKPYNNISDYDLALSYMFQYKSLPTSVTSALFPSHHVVGAVSLNLNKERAYVGNTSYSLIWTTPVASGASVMIHKLFKTEVKCSPSMHITGAIWCSVLESARFYWILRIAGGVPEVKLPVVFSAAKNGWALSNIPVQGVATGAVIKGIYLAAETEKRDSRVEVCLGHFGLYDRDLHWLKHDGHEAVSQGKITSVATFANPNSLAAPAGKAIVDLELRWETAAAVRAVLAQYRVYLYGQRRLTGG